jgi:predicted AAA+ superfamily ATPase
MEFIQRNVYFQLKAHLSNPEMSLILGPRQAGKTTIMEKLAQELKDENKPTAYFNLDVVEDFQYFKSQHTLLAQAEKITGKPDAVVFIDEIHRLKNSGLFLKGLHDLKSNHKFIISGSGSLELKSNIIEPLTGRKRVFYCMPLSFTEFSASKLSCPLLHVYLELEANPFIKNRLIEEYMTYGGYPKVVMAKSAEEKIASLREIYESYLEKDIQLILGVEKPHQFNTLFKIISSQVGNILNKAEVSSVTGLDIKTTERYLYFLEKTFVISLVRPFFRNARKELTKMPKVYLNDMGFISMSQGFNRQKTGGVFENACFLRLQELNLINPINYWRAKFSDAEVDFIVTNPTNGDFIPIEAKTSTDLKTVGRGVFSFATRYNCKKAFIYNRESSGSIVKNGLSVSFSPYHKLPFLEQ